VDGITINQKSNNMYYVSGAVKDEKGVAIPRVLVGNGKKSIFTDKDGNYQIEGDNITKKITYFKIGYQNEILDLSKYQDESSVNGNLTMKSSTSNDAIPGEKGGNPYVETEEKGLTKKQMKVIGFSLLGVALILTSVLIYKAVKKN
jgi:hypothetical protein